MKKIYLILTLIALSGSIFSQNYTVLGDASSLSGCNCFRLTPDANDQAGAIFQNNTINLNNSFDYTFNVFLGCNGASGADGICFVLTSNPNGLGNQGEGLGYAGGNQPYSLAVEFDTWQNGSPANDPPYDHIGIESGGLYDHNVAAAVPALTSQSNIDNCQWHTVRIVWDVNTNTYSVYFDGVLRQTVVIPNMVGTYFGGNPIVNWGWTGATGGGTNDQQVCEVSNSNWVGGINYQSCNTTVQFSDISTSNIGTVQSWAWTFGDGATSSQQNPVHTYASTGTYTASLTITDIAGCTNTYSHTITINPPIALTPTLNAPPCNGGSNGSIVVSATGGFGVSAGYGGYTYTWNDGTVGPNDIGLTAGTYTVTGTDGVCTTTAQYTLNQPPPLTAVVTHTDASCGANNGTASITLSGGTQPYTAVTWTGGFSGTTITGLAPGLYIADFHDANGCSALLQYKTTIASLPCGYNLTTSSTNVSCFGGSNGSATVTVTGGVAPTNISWSNGGSGATITGLPAGNYTYHYTDGGSGNFTGTITVNQPGAAMVASLSTVNMSCASTNDGQALASVTSGGVSPYSYTWSGGQPNNAVASNLSAGAVTVTITDINGCTATASGNITGPPALTVTTTAIDDSCYQGHLGSATANVSGGNSPYTFYWSNISSAQTNLSLGIGTYTVTVTDDKGCTATGTATINQPTAFSYTMTSQNVLCNGSSTGSISISASGGITPYIYTWNPNTVSGNNPTGLAAGLYHVTITDNNHCGNPDSVFITQPDSALLVTSSHTDVTCYNANNGSVTITVGGGTPPYSYQGNPVPAGTTTLNNLPPGTYSGNVTDANGCSVAVSETISQPGVQSLSFTTVDNTCNGGTSGSATAAFANATGSVTYDWSNSQSGATISSLSAGTYTVTATDQNTCALIDSVVITEPSAPVMTVTVVDATCYGANGSATANPSGGTAPFSYTWSSSSVTTQTAPIPAGSYTVTATDAGSCNQTASFTVNQPTGMNIQETHTDVNCYGDSSGSIQLTVSGGTGPTYTYNWNPSVSTSNVVGLLSAQTYFITVTDQASCTDTISVTINQPAQALTLNLQSNNISCYGVLDGSIHITASGGTPSYTYAWNPNVSSTDSATGLGPGTYTITVTDTKNCTVVPSVTISQPNQPLSLTSTQVDLTCYQSANGQAVLNVVGGTFPYTYSWNPNVSTGDTASGLAAGNYAITVTDDHGCTNTSTLTLTEPAALVTSEAHTDVLCNGEQTGSITLSSTGGTPSYNYVWSPNVSSNDSAQNLTAGAYNITTTDANNCSVLTVVSISEPPVLMLTLTPTAALCFGDSSGSIASVVNGGVPNYSFAASDGTHNYTSSTGQFSSLSSGNYTVVVTDQNTCADTATTIVTEPVILTDVLTPTNVLCYHYSNGQIAVTANGGTPTYSYQLSTGSSNANGVFSDLVAGNYQVTITDAHGCITQDSAKLTEPDSVLVSVSPSPVEVKLGSDLQIQITTNQNGLINYVWNPSFGLSCYDCDNPVFNGVYSQQYLLTATTTDGCVGTSQFEVTVVPNYDLFIPNAFTPNGDGVNDVWMMFGNLSALKQVDIAVFNRIGEKVFESHDIHFAWDGTYKGQKVGPGVYVYSAKFVWLNNHADDNYHGSITILR